MLRPRFVLPVPLSPLRSATEDDKYQEDFLLLCPAHSSVKFPSEKSRSRLPKAEPLPKTNHVEICSLETKPTMKKEFVLCGSALSHGDKRLMEKLAAKFNATISRYWNPSVTHVIASANEKGACTRTLKVLMGILNGKWIITADWMKASLEANKLVDEEPFEIHIDTQGCEDGPKTAKRKREKERRQRRKEHGEDGGGSWRRKLTAAA